jgi:hypothetical protein
MTFNFLGPGLTVNVEAKVKEQIILDSSEIMPLFVQIEHFRKTAPNSTYQNPLFSTGCV